MCITNITYMQLSFSFWNKKRNDKRYVKFVICYSLFIIYHLLFIIYHLVSIIYYLYLLIIIHYHLSFIRVFIVYLFIYYYYLLSIICYLLLVFCYLWHKILQFVIQKRWNFGIVGSNCFKTCNYLLSFFFCFCFEKVSTLWLCKIV